MINIQQELLASEEVMKQIFERLYVATEGDSEVGQILAEFMAESNRRDQLMKTFTLLRFEKKTTDSNNQSNVLMHEQKETVIKEMKVLEQICDIGLRSKKAEDVDINPSLFKDFSKAVKDKCPFLTSIVEALVIGSNNCERNTHKIADKKVLCGYHALALLLNVRNSKCFNDFPLLFGLLCFSYGAGKQFINMLKSVGISLHFDTM